MKTLKIFTIGMMLFLASNSMNAQVSINVNIGTPPVWAPVDQPAAGFYYIPDIQCYYDVRATQFIYLNSGVWIRSRNLPDYCRNYDLNRGYKVVLTDYHGSRPYVNYRYDRVKYYKGYRGPQRVAEHRHYDNHDRYYADNRYDYDDRGHGHGHGHGKGHRH